MYDSHCHLDDVAYVADVEAVLVRAAQASVEGIFVPCCSPRQWPSLPAFCAQSPLLSFGLGIHPWYIDGLDTDTLDSALHELEPTLTRTRAVAVGECGLDAKHAKQHGASMDLQAKVLDAQISAAHNLGLPVVLHCVHAHGLLLERLEAQGPLPRGGVMHSYGGPAELVPRYQRLGLSFSFAGIITHDNAQRPKHALCAVPPERLLLESDGPDQRPSGVEGARSEPAHLAVTLAHAARLRGESVETLDRLTTENAKRLFAPHSSSVR